MFSHGRGRSSVTLTLLSRRRVCVKGLFACEWGLMKKTSSNRPAGRGRSSGSARTQFSSTNQPVKRRIGTKEQSRIESERKIDAMDSLMSVILEELTVTDGKGKKIKIIALEA